MKTCICCQKRVRVVNNDDESDCLTVCGTCQPWVESHNDLINGHQKKLLQHINPAAKSTFEAMGKLERGYIVLRAMEKEAS